MCRVNLLPQEKYWPSHFFEKTVHLRLMVPSKHFLFSNLLSNKKKRINFYRDNHAETEFCRIFGQILIDSNIE